MSTAGAPAIPLPLRVIPPLRVGRGRARLLVERNVVAYRRGWIFLVSGFFEPLFYLMSIGLGLNHLVGHLAIGSRSIPYTDYVAPGLLASSAMNGAIFDATFGVFFKLKIAKTYDAVLRDSARGSRRRHRGTVLVAHPRHRLLDRFPRGDGRARADRLLVGRALPARRHAGELRVRRYRDVRLPATCAAGRTST